MREETEKHENTELQEGEEPGVGAEPVAATEATPAIPLDEPDHQHSDANAPNLATLEGKKEPGLPVEAAATTPLAGSTNNERRPAVDLVEHQLNTSVTRNYNQETGSKLRKGTFDLYSRLAPRDAIDSMLAGAMVGLSNATMDCFDRANWSGRARELNLRYGIKGAATLADLSKLYDSRRGRGGQNVTVGKVNVEAGGQAIVGNIETGERRKATKPQSVPAFPSTEDED